MSTVVDTGIAVLRNLPAEALLPGMTTHGGVVRNATGQIVAHLLTPSSAPTSALTALAGGPVGVGGAAVSAVSGIGANIQLVQLSHAVEKVYQLSMAATALSALGLVTSVVGFAYLKHRLDRVDQAISAVAKEVKEVHKLLQSMQRARLLAAVDAYRIAEETADSSQRQQLLMHARNLFSELTHHYRAQLSEQQELVAVEAAEGYFAVSMLGTAITTSDLGMGDAAHRQFANDYGEWTALARKHCARLLRLADPADAAALLDARYVDDLPVDALIAVLDFAHFDRSGLQWIDRLRRHVGRIKFPKAAIEKAALEYGRRLQARNDVLDSYVAHFGFLAERKVSATDYSRALLARSKPDCLVIDWVKAPSEGVA